MEVLILLVLAVVGLVGMALNTAEGTTFATTRRPAAGDLAEQLRALRKYQMLDGLDGELDGKIDGDIEF